MTSSAKAIVITPDQDFTNSHYNYIRIGYLFIFFCFSAYTPFASVLFESKGFTPLENGFLNVVRPFCTLVVIPPVAYLAERYNHQSTFMYIGATSTAILMSMIFLSDDKTTITWLVIVLFILMTPLSALYDEHTLCVLGEEHKRFYGSFRSYGAKSWLVGSLVASLIWGHFGFGWLSIFAVIGCTGFMFAVYKTPVERQAGEHHYIDVWKFTLTNARITTFLVGLSVAGIGFALIGTFLNLFLVSEELRAPPVLLGLRTVFTVLIEIPIFRNAEKLHNSFNDIDLFMLGMYAYSLRVFGYSFLPNAWLVLILEPLHGISYAASFLAGISFFKKNFPKEWSNSAVGLVYASTWGLAGLIGLPLGGYLYEQVGPRKLFQISGVFSIFSAVVFYVLMNYVFVEKKEEENTKVDEVKIEVEEGKSE